MLGGVMVGMSGELLPGVGLAAGSEAPAALMLLFLVLLLFKPFFLHQSLIDPFHPSPREASRPALPASSALIHAAFTAPAGVLTHGRAAPRLDLGTPTQGKEFQMLRATETAEAPDAALLRVLETARGFLSCRDRMAAAATGRLPPPRDLGEAIGRDFLAFDLERAAEALQAAVAAASTAQLPAVVGSRAATQ
jgi:hypothetical protein